MKYAGNFPDIHRHRGSVGGASGLEAAEKLDPPEDVSVRGPGHTQPHPVYHQPRPPHKECKMDQLDCAAKTNSYSDYVCEDFGQILPRNARSETKNVRPSHDHNGEKSHEGHGCGHGHDPKSTAKPHVCAFLTLLHPKVDRNAVKRQKEDDLA